jgi:hypothetical protein
MTKVEVFWRDSCGPYGIWISQEEAKRIEVGQCISVGYLFSKDKTCVKLVQSVAGPKDALGNLLVIPRANVWRIRELK